MPSVRCPGCGRMIQPVEGHYAVHTITERGVRTCPFSRELLQPELPGVNDYAARVATAAGDQWAGVLGSEKARRKTPMTPFGEQVAARLKEMFHAYWSRQERSQQKHLGPSEIGHPCDRRLALSLMQAPPVNPGGDGWAAFVGTCVHVGLADMFMWADGDTGRFATEVPLEFPYAVVPRGTTDCLDRVLCLVLDQKVLGGWSLDKLSTNGPPEHYRVQVHTYGLGLTLRGERIEKVAIVAWPRERSSLDGLYVWEEDYDASVARTALERASRIGGMVADLTDADAKQKAEMAGTFPIDNSDCRFCKWHKKGAKTLEMGCDGRG